ncbi:MAG: hypothetical protein U0892_21750 [Pirellulales bacterium]
MSSRRMKPWILTVFAAGLSWAAVVDSAANSFAQDTVPVRAGRRLSPDAIYTVQPALEAGETTVGPIDLPFLASAGDLNWAPPTFPAGRPNYAPGTESLQQMGKSVTLHQDVWGFEFTFKPVRMIAVDFPKAGGGVESKLVWYLLYRIRYTGNDLQPKQQADQFGNPVYSDPAAVTEKAERRFVPRFTLSVPALGGSYAAQFLPYALGPIAEKERIGKPLFDSIAIQRTPIKLSTPQVRNDVWGVATWVGVDPRTDFFTVEVSGLTNAQKAEIKDGKLEFTQKTLVLNFSSPGDTVNELLDQIRYGVPASDDPVKQAEILRQYGLKERLDHYWVYR